MVLHRLFLALITASTALPAFAGDGQIFDAEEAAIHQATVYPDPNARGGRAVGAFGDRSGAHIEFENLPPADSLHVHYNNGTGKAQQGGLYVNGKRVKTLVFEPTDDWYSPFETVSHEGPVSGTVRIQIDAEDLAHNGTFACNVDAISLDSPDL